MIKLVSCILLMQYCAALEAPDGQNNERRPKPRSFEIDYQNNEFLMDGKRFQYIAGSLHYFRVPHQYWKDRLRKLRAGGLNAVDTYVEWSFHNPQPNLYNWEGDANLLNFIQLAQEQDLYVILRVGPFIGAERDFGGQPWWLLSEYGDELEPRTSNKEYMTEVRKWLKVLLAKIKPMLYGNYGPVIMIQIENEYGSLGQQYCDNRYKEDLYDIFAEALGDFYFFNKVVLFTTDGYWDNMPKCGKIRHAYATVDFGVSDAPGDAWAAQRAVEPVGPLVNSEFYAGWLTHWGGEPANVGIEALMNTLRKILKKQASLSFYMYCGGTNFGFTNGANFDEKGYKPQITSYDYDAPLTEAGDPTAKYLAVRQVIGEFMPLPNVELPRISTKGDYGRVVLRPYFALFHEYHSLKNPNRVNDTIPLTFESLKQNAGFVIYENKLLETKVAILTAENLKDRALVYLNEVYIGTLDRQSKKFSLTLNAKKNSILKIVVENQGRINYGAITKEFKGLNEPVLWGETELKQWIHTTIPLERQPLEGDGPQPFDKIAMAGNLTNGPVVYFNTFNLPRGISGVLRDTFLDMKGWGKGVVWINGYNLGRYWPSVGPQETLYVPAIYLKHEDNKLFVLELEMAPDYNSVYFITEPILGNATPGVMSFATSIITQILSLSFIILYSF